MCRVTQTAQQWRPCCLSRSAFLWEITISEAESMRPFSYNIVKGLTLVPLISWFIACICSQARSESRAAHYRWAAEEAWGEERRGEERRLLNITDVFTVYRHIIVRTGRITFKLSNLMLYCHSGPSWNFRSTDRRKDYLLLVCYC